MLFRACIIAVVVFPMVLADLGAAAQSNLSSQIERNIEALANSDATVRETATSALGKIGLAAVPALTAKLADPDPMVQEAAANALVQIGPAAEPAVLALVKALTYPDTSVQETAASALGELGLAAVPALTAALTDPDPKVRWVAANALGEIGPAAEPAVLALIAMLTDQDARVRVMAIYALGEIGPAAEPGVPVLTAALAHPDTDIQAAAASALGAVGPAAVPAVPALTAALAHPEVGVRRAAASALEEIGPAAEAAVPALIATLADQDVRVQAAATNALGKIGLAAVPALNAILADPSPKVRRAAASALGEIAPAAEPAVPTLVKALADPDVQEQAANALGRIATSLGDAKAIGALGVLREAQTALENNANRGVREHAAPVKRAVEYLELKWWTITTKDVVDWIKDHPYTASIVFVISIIPIWIVLCFGISWLKPVTILTINDFLRPFDFKFNKVAEFTVSPRRFLLISFLSRRPRVLDAWVYRHVGKARENFERKPTVEKRSVHVPVPVHINKETIEDLKGEHLRAVFGTGTGRLLIWGEGGAGKTSIACQIARWAMADALEKRPAPHRMLPVLIERELDFEVGEGKDPFTETVRGDLEKLIEVQVDDELLAAILKQRRVLVIVDHLSEMTEATRRRVRPDVPNFPAAALIVTSRLPEPLGDVPKISLRPLGVTGDYLFEFMGAYLKAQSVRELFPDREFGSAGARIAELVGERDVTVLLVKLYLDRLIAMKEKGSDIDQEMPGSIPSLMLGYLNDINRAVPEDVRRDDLAVHRDAEALAWTCLEERFRPAPVRIDEGATPALAAVNPEGVKERLDYLERRLRLIETVEPERNRVHFALDPVAEYLAGLHAVERYQADAEVWWEFLARTDEMTGGLEAIRGFLLAVRDCCLYKGGDEVEVPEFVSDELAKRAGLDLEWLRQARMQERIARYTRQLEAADVDDRHVAAETLGRIGPAAEPAVPALVKALADRAVRQQAIDALGRIGPAAEPAIPALVEAIADRAVRQQAIKALGGIGPAAVPALVETLADRNPDLRQHAAFALGRIGPAAEPAIPALVEALALADQHRAVRQQAIDALGRIGPAAVPALVETLADRDPDLRQHAAFALGEIGPAGAPAVPTLIEALALADQDRLVRRRAAFALRRIGRAAEPAVPALVEALANPDLAVKKAAAHALAGIGQAAMPALVEALVNPDLAVRKAAAHALAGIGQAAMPALVEALANPDLAVRKAAAHALARIGPAAKQTMPS